MPPAAGPQQPPPPPPPVYPNAPPPGEQPLPPRYQPLGAKAEPDVERGDWDPWEHPSPGAYSHDGFYLRLAIGFGGAGLAGHNHVRSDVDETRLSGFGFGTSIGIGGALAENVILNADLFHATIFDPSVRVDGHHVGDANDVGGELGIGEDVDLVGLGIGVTYYIMPANVYLAGSAGFGQAVFTGHRGDRAGSDIGIAGNLMVGKEWWVGNDWGLGIAGQAILLGAHDDILGRINGFALNVMFSATYN